MSSERGEHHLSSDKRSANPENYTKKKKTGDNKAPAPAVSLFKSDVLKPPRRRVEGVSSGMTQEIIFQPPPTNPVEKSEGLDSEIFIATGEIMAAYGLKQTRTSRMFSGLPVTRWQNRNYYRRDDVREVWREYHKNQRSSEGTYLVDGVEMAPKNYFNSEFGVSYYQLKKHFEGLPERKVGRVTLFPVSTGLERLEPFLELPEVDKKTGIYKDEEKTEWASVSGLSKLFNVSEETIISAIDETSSLLYIKAINGKLTKGYKVAAIRKQISGILARPSFDSKETKEEMLTSQQLADEYDLTLREVVSFLRPIAVKMSGGNFNGYPKSLARERLDAFFAYPEVDKKVRKHTTEEGDVYMSQQRIADELGIRIDKVIKINKTKNVPHLPTRSGMETIVLYKISDVVAALQAEKVEKERQAKIRQAKAIKEINERVGRYLSGQKEEEKNLLTEDLLALGLTYKVQRYYPGGYPQLREDYNLTPIRRTNWESMAEKEKKERIEKRARELLADGIVLSSKSIKKVSSTFDREIRREYPGGIIALRHKLGVEDTVKEERDWKKEKNPAEVIRAEVKAVIAQNKGQLTTPMLESKMLWAIANYYPGGYQQLRSDLGLEKKEKPKGYWTESQIEQDALSIYLQHGELSVKLLKTVAGLDQATYTKYPGKLRRLKSRVAELKNMENQL